MNLSEIVLNTARESMRAWYNSVAPALFPFMVLMPALTCPAAANVWERLLGRFTRSILKLPGCAAAAIVIAMTAGSPAGAISARRICTNGEISREELERLLWCVCGMSPAFLVTGVGASMLANASDGRLLLRAQLFSQIIMLLLTRGVRPMHALARESADEAKDPIRTAVGNVLAVCGYMTAFAIAAALLAQLLHSEIVGRIALCLFDVPSGANALSKIAMNREVRLVCLAAICGFGGVCIAAQNLAACRNLGISAGKYFLSRAIHALLNASAMLLQLRWNTPTSLHSLPPFEISALIAAFLLLPMLISWKIEPFLNKEKSEKIVALPPEKAEKPQNIVSLDMEKPQYLEK